MTGAAEISLCDLVHGDLVGTGPHFETQFTVTYNTAEANAMEPVREDHWSDAFLVGALVQQHIGIFRESRRRIQGK